MPKSAYRQYKKIRTIKLSGNRYFHIGVKRKTGVRGGTAEMTKGSIHKVGS